MRTVRQEGASMWWTLRDRLLARLLRAQSAAALFYFPGIKWSIGAWFMSCTCLFDASGWQVSGFFCFVTYAAWKSSTVRTAQKCALMVPAGDKLRLYSRKAEPWSLKAVILVSVHCVSFRGGLWDVEVGAGGAHGALQQMSYHEVLSWVTTATRSYLCQGLPCSYPCQEVLQARSCIVCRCMSYAARRVESPVVRGKSQAVGAPSKRET